MRPFGTKNEKTALRNTGDLPVLCTCTDAALLLRCSPEAVARMARDGKLRGVKRGSTWLFRREDLLAYVDSLFAAESR